MRVAAIRFLPVISIMAVFVLAVGACSNSDHIRRDPTQNKGAPVMQWPPPPQNPRVLYISAIEDPSDIGLSKSSVKKALSRIFGEEKPPSVMVRPHGVFADNERVYISDPGFGCCHIFDLRRKKYFLIERAGAKKLLSPIGVAVDDRGDIYISDSLLKHIFVFDKDGKYLREIGSPGFFGRPTGIAIDGNRLFVVDTHAHRVLVLSKDNGSLLFGFGKNGTAPGDFNYPTNIALSKDKLIYVTDSMNFRIQSFTGDGSFLNSFGKPGDGSGYLSRPKGIAVDSEGHIYVVDSHFDNVQIFDAEGNLLLVFGSSGNGGGEFILPAGIYIDSSDRIYVADSYNRRIQVFQYVRDAADKLQSG